MGFALEILSDKKQIQVGAGSTFFLQVLVL
jgi:hypothetical protein